MFINFAFHIQLTGKPHGPKSRLQTAWRVAVMLLVMASCSSISQAADEPTKVKKDDTVAFFESGKIPVLKLIIPELQQKMLRERPREYVQVALNEDGERLFDAIAIKLKGAAGSFRGFDDMPGFTLNIDKYTKGQRYHGMKRLHLNNAVQDGTYLNEWLGAELFRAAGYPCSRVGHARLYVNNRDLGLYVVREGFDQPYLRRELSDSNGNLYDGGFLQDVDSALQLDAGPTPNNRNDIIGLAVACSQDDPAARWRGIAERVDMDKFITFMAMERLCGHWDGYSLNINNYRLYFPPKGRAIFLPHGMDQLFGDPNAGLYDHASPLISLAVMQNNVWREQYHERLKKLLPLFQPVDRWHAKIDTMQQRLETVLKSINIEKAKAHKQQVQELKKRLAERSKNVAEIIRRGPAKAVKFDVSEIKVLKDWYPAGDGDDAKLEKIEIDDVRCFRIDHKKFGDRGSAWRYRVMLPRGEYRIEARMKSENVVPIPDNQPRGVGLRYSNSRNMDGFAGTTNWQKVTYDISIKEDIRDIEFSLELRARYGIAYFDRDSLRIQRIK